MASVEDPKQRALLAEALLGETRSPQEQEVASSLQHVEERILESDQRNLRAAIAEAERRGDLAEVVSLTQRKLDLDRALRRLDAQNSGNR